MSGPGPYGPAGPYAYGGPGSYGGPPAPPRPATVTVAGVLTTLLGGVGILGGLLVGLGIAILGAVVGDVSESKSPGEGDGVTAFFVVVAVVFVVLAVGGSALYLLLGVRVLRGGTTARVVLTVWNVLGVVAALAWSGVLLADVVANWDGEPTDLINPLFWALVLGTPAVVVTVLLWTSSARAWFALPPEVRQPVRR